MPTLSLEKREEFLSSTAVVGADEREDSDIPPPLKILHRKNRSKSVSSSLNY